MGGSDFAARLLAWQRRHGRHDLPWQGAADPYRVWVSEVMLQQTRVATVLDYYPRFLARFPGVEDLGAAPLEQVLQLWSGLGYYARARQLHACAREVVERHGGRFPGTAAGLAALPGIGRSTAAAIAALCHGERSAIVDGNVRRVLARQFAVPGRPGAAAFERELLAIAERLLPPSPDMAVYTQAIMDLGATVCMRARPDCDGCPVAGSCAARAQGRVAEFPAARPRRVVPVRHRHLLLAVRGAAVLVEQRAHSGIWGGLLSLPEFPGRAALARRAAGLSAEPIRCLPVRTHAFTHFTLEFTPCLQVVPSAVSATEASEQWLPLAAVEGAALPAPIRTLLLELHAGDFSPARGVAGGSGPRSQAARRRR